jgi:hypothetical protein
MGPSLPRAVVQGVHGLAVEITNSELLKKIILPQAERLLSLEDRNPHSPTFGCFDRDFWAWKFKDLQDACMQNGVYALALLWGNDFDGNIYYRNERLLNWTIAGLDRWLRIQHKNGSFDQIFPNEYSYAATAFTLFAMLESYKILEPELPAILRDKFLVGTRKAAKFLLCSQEEHDRIANHLCAAATALFEYHSFIGDACFKHKADEILAAVFKDADEGWLLEYGGADPGYQTLALYYLAKHYLKSKDPGILAKLEKTVEFLSYFVLPDGSFGGEYGSRNTEVLYPAGFFLVRDQIPLAKKITGVFLNNISSNGIISLQAIDDGNLVPLMISYLEAHLAASNPSPDSTGATLPPLPFEQEPFHKWMKNAGLYLVNTKNYYAILGTCKNGLLKVYNKNRKMVVYDDCGYTAETRGGDFLSSQYLNPDVLVETRPDSLTITGSLSKTSWPLPTPGKMLFLRFLNITICKSKYLGNKIKRILVWMLIKKRHKGVISLRRHVAFFDERISVTDKLRKPSSLEIRSLSRGERYTTIHMATSGYFKKSELRRPQLFKAFDVDKFNRDSELETSVTI